MKKKQEQKTTPPMPSFRIGRFIQYGGESEPKFRPAHEIGYDAAYDFFRDLYWNDRKEAEDQLVEYKRLWKDKAVKGSSYIADTDPELGERFKRRACTQEDCRKPYYEKMKEASSAVEKWEWFKDFIIGDWTEPATVYRLNTLPSENNWAGEEMRKEIIQKLDWYGYVTVGWSCLGHTRARWQTDSVCDWVKREHPEWKVVNNEFDCTITKKQSKKA